MCPPARLVRRREVKRPVREGREWRGGPPGLDPAKDGAVEGCLASIWPGTARCRAARPRSSQERRGGVPPGLDPEEVAVPSTVMFLIHICMYTLFGIPASATDVLVKFRITQRRRGMLQPYSLRSPRSMREVLHCDFSSGFPCVYVSSRMESTCIAITVIGIHHVMSFVNRCDYFVHVMSLERVIQNFWLINTIMKNHP